MVPDPEKTPRSQVEECATIEARMHTQTMPLNSSLPTTISWSFFWVRYHKWWMTRSLPVINTYFIWFLKWLKQAGIEMVCLDWYRNHLFLTFLGIEQQKPHGITPYSPDIFSWHLPICLYSCPDTNWSGWISILSTLFLDFGCRRRFG